MPDLRELYQEVILEHNKAPRNYRELVTANHRAEDITRCVVTTSPSTWIWRATRFATSASKAQDARFLRRQHP